MLMKIVEKIVTLCLIWVFGSLSCLSLLVQILRHGLKILEVKPRPVPPPILTNEKYGKHNYMNLKGRGIKIHYVEKGDPKNPLLLCLHGFPEFWFSWRHQLTELSSKFWVVAIDLRGYGDSSKPSKLSEYSHDAAVDDIRDFILSLERSDCTLLAHDFGAVFAWTLVTKYPKLVQRHISINGPHAGILKHLIRTTLDQFKKSWYIFFFNAPWIPEKMLAMNDLAFIDSVFKASSFPDDVIEAYKFTFSKPGAMTPPLNFYRTIFLKNDTDDYSDRKITVPTLIIWGKNDTALSPENAKMCAKLCEDVQLKFIDGAGHFAHEDQWHKVNEHILEYCQSFK